MGKVIIFKAHVVATAPDVFINGSVAFLDGTKVLATFPVDTVTFDAYFTTSTLSPGEHAITAHYLGNGISGESFSPPVLEVVTGSPTPAPTAGSDLVTSVLRKHGKFLLQVTDATGAVRLSRAFPVRVQVLRQDVNGDGLLDVVVQWRRHRKLHRLAFSGRDLAPLPAGPA